MSFDDREASLSDGQPIRLYEFQRGLKRWRYTNADRSIEFDTHAWQAITITDNGIRQTGETSADELLITVPWDNEIAQMYRGVPPSDEIFVILRNMHHLEPEVRIAGQVTIIGVRWPSMERAEIRCSPLSTSFERPGLRLAWERGCPYSVYDADCKVDPADHRLVTILESLDGISIVSADFASQADGWFGGGYVEWDIGSGQLERRHVQSHVTSMLRLLGGTDGMAAGMQVSAYPGCARVIQVCHDKFDNKDTYGGIPHLPGKSPFDGDPIF